MNLKKRFIISNILMLITPIISVGVISVFFLILFVLQFPTDAYILATFGAGEYREIAEHLNMMFVRSPEVLVYIYLYALSCIAAIIATLTVITHRLSESIIPPLQNLTDAVENIKSGSLEFEILSTNDCELNNLCTTFDELRRRLLESNKKEEFLNHERSILLANLSHDLKTPVAAIQGYVQAISDGLAANPETLERYLNTISQKSDSINKMIDSISIFSMLEADTIEFCFTVSDIFEYLRGVTDDFRLDAENANCKLIVNIPEGKCYVGIDHKLMYRVFANLIDNSIKYRSGNDSRIIVSVSENDNGVTISIADNGIGMADDELEKIFDSFYRIDASRSIKGSGLGLGIVRQIVNGHSGRIWFKKGLEIGSEAVIYLPKRIKSSSDADIDK